MKGSHLLAFVSDESSAVGLGGVLCQIVVGEWVRVGTLPIEFLLRHLYCSLTVVSGGGAVGRPFLLLS